MHDKNLYKIWGTNEYYLWLIIHNEKFLDSLINWLLLLKVKRWRPTVQSSIYDWSWYELCLKSRDQYLSYTHNENNVECKQYTIQIRIGVDWFFWLSQGKWELMVTVEQSCLVTGEQRPYLTHCSSSDVVACYLLHPWTWHSSYTANG